MRLPSYSASSGRLRTDEQSVISPAGCTGKWWTSSLHRILRDPTYEGEAAAFRSKTVQQRGKRWRRVERTPREEWISLPDGVTPAIVAPALWDAVERRLSSNTGANTRNEQRPFLLRGMVRCAQCGSAMMVENCK